MTVGADPTGRNVFRQGTPAVVAQGLGGDTAGMVCTWPEGRRCVGDGDSSCDISISELIIGVNIALGNQSLDLCPAFDPSGNGGVEINELILAVNNALDGCP